MVNFFLKRTASPLLPDRCDSVRRHKHLRAEEPFTLLFFSIVILLPRQRLNSTLSILHRHLGCISQSPQSQPLQTSSSVFSLDITLALAGWSVQVHFSGGFLKSYPYA